MDLILWYAVTLGGFVTFCFLSHRILLMIRVALSYAAFCFLKQKYYPQVHRHVRGSGKLTRFDIVLLVLFVIRNIICLVFEVKDVAGFVERSGVICTINLVPLALGEHMNIVASWCRLSLGTYTRMHKWLGIVAIVEGLLHMAVGAASHNLDLRTTSGIAMLAVGRLEILTK